MLLQMVIEVSLVQPLNPQWPTAVTKGTLCKETKIVPASPTVLGVGVHLLAIVSCFAIRCYTIDVHRDQKPIRSMILQCDDSWRFYRHRANGQQLEWQYTCSAWFRSNYAQCVQSIVTYNITYNSPLWSVCVHRYMYVLAPRLCVYGVCVYTVNASVFSFVKYIVDVLAWLLLDMMSVSISACLFGCDVCTCIVATMKVSPVPFL